MPFETEEASRENGSPVEVYQVVYGRNAGAIYYLTDAPVTLTVEGQAYDPIPIMRTSGQLEGNGEKSDIQIKVALNTVLAALFLGDPPSVVVTVAIFKGHMPDDPSTDIPLSDFQPVWGGIITEARREGSVCEMTCKTPLSDLEMPGLRRFYQWQCPHILYGVRCKADKAAATVDLTVTSLTLENGQKVVRFVEGTDWNKAGTNPDDYIGGYLTWTGPNGVTYALIRDGNNGNVVVTGSTDGLSNGVAVAVSLGCARNLNACGRLHDNLVNYGGQPWIPTENPLDRNNFG